jgi:hypothetical protein
MVVSPCECRPGGPARADPRGHRAQPRHRADGPAPGGQDHARPPAPLGGLAELLRPRGPREPRTARGATDRARVAGGPGRAHEAHRDRRLLARRARRTGGARALAPRRVPARLARAHGGGQLHLAQAVHPDAARTRPAPSGACALPRSRCCASGRCSLTVTARGRAPPSLPRRWASIPPRPAATSTSCPMH